MVCCDITWIVDKLLSPKKDKESLIDIEVCLTHYERIRNYLKELVKILLLNTQPSERSQFTVNAIIK